MNTLMALLTVVERLDKLLVTSEKFQYIEIFLYVTDVSSVATRVPECRTAGARTGRGST